MLAHRDEHVNILVIVADLLRGVVHTRHTVAARAGVSLPTADRWIKSIVTTLPGARTRKAGKTALVEMRQPKGLKR